MQCPHCEHSFAKSHLVPTGDLQLALSEDERAKYDFYREQLQLAFSSDQSPFWAARQMQERFGVRSFIPQVWGRHAVFGPNPSNADVAAYQEYLERVCDRLQNGANARDRLISSCLSLEFGNRSARYSVRKSLSREV